MNLHRTTSVEASSQTIWTEFEAPDSSFKRRHCGAYSMHPIYIIIKRWNKAFDVISSYPAGGVFLVLGNMATQYSLAFIGMQLSDSILDQKGLHNPKRSYQLPMLSSSLCSYLPSLWSVLHVLLPSDMDRSNKALSFHSHYGYVAGVSLTEVIASSITVVMGTTLNFFLDGRWSACQVSCCETRLLQYWACHYCIHQRKAKKGLHSTESHIGREPLDMLTAFTEHWGPHMGLTYYVSPNMSSHMKSDTAEVWSLLNGSCKYDASSISSQQSILFLTDFLLVGSTGLCFAEFCTTQMVPIARLKQGKMLWWWSVDIMIIWAHWLQASLAFTAHLSWPLPIPCH